jgi:hypothetical protein
MGTFEWFGKFIILFGILLIIIGLGVLFLPKIPLLGKLPGDIYIKKGNFHFYFPIVSCILLSIILTILFSILFRK